MKYIKWLKMCYPGLDMGAVYSVEKEWEDWLFFFNEFGRQIVVHSCYKGILFEEVSHAS